MTELDSYLAKYSLNDVQPITAASISIDDSLPSYLVTECRKVGSFVSGQIEVQIAKV